VYIRATLKIKCVNFKHCNLLKKMCLIAYFLNKVMPQFWCVASVLAILLTPQWW